MAAKPPVNNLAALREGIRAYNADDLESWSEWLDPGIEWVIAPEHPAARTLYGIEDVLAYQHDWEEMLGGLRLEEDEVNDRGETIAWFGRVCGKGAGSGAPVEVPIAFLTTISNGRARRIEEFLNLEEARRVADGL